MRANASDVVFNMIRKKLLSGEWSKGSKISTEMQLAKEAGVSRTSVREAIERLTTVGVLVRRQGDGTYVNDMTPKVLINEMMPQFIMDMYDVIDVLDFREMMEPVAIKRLIENYDEKKIETMVECVEKMSRYSDLRESDEFAQADMQFHLAILRGSHNAIVDRIVDLIEDTLICYQFDANRTIGPKSGVQEHTAIIDAIFKRDSELASLLVKRHIQRSKRDISKQLMQERKQSEQKE